MAKHGKKFTAAAAQVEDRSYSIEDAIPLVQKVKYAKFDETVELSMRLGVDPKHADQMVRGTVVLPHGLGKSKRVLAIVGAIALLWTLVGGFDREPEVLPGTPGISVIGDPRDFAIAYVMSSGISRYGHVHGPTRG